MTRASQKATAQIKSNRQLIARMGKLEGEEREALRLNLRSQVRRLLTKVRVFPNGHVVLFLATSQRRALSIADGQAKIWDAYPKKHFPEGKPKS